MYKHILIPTDGSECSQAALELGLALAVRLGAAVRLLNVLEPGDEPLEAGLPTRQTLLRNIARHHGKLALEQGAELAQKHHLTFQTRQPSGWPEQEILEQAEDCDLVVMGTHGRAGLDRWIMGSVAQAVVAKSSRPVLVVHAPTKDSPEPPRDFARILITTDGSECSQGALQHGLALAKALDAQATVLLASEYSFHYLEPALTLSPELDQLERRLHGWGQEVLAEAQAQAQQEGLSVQTRLVKGKPLPCILAEAPKHDLVVMGTHGRSGWNKIALGSVSEGVVRRCTKPVLVVPARCTAQ
jgi:nucleotide-binding universal stress UspA family protein